MPSHHNLAFTQTWQLFLDFFFANLRESSRKFRVSRKNAVTLQRNSGGQKLGENLVLSDFLCNLAA